MFIIPPVGRILRRDAILTQFIPAIVVFVVLLLLAIVSWQSTVQTLETQQARALDEDRTFIETALTERMAATSILIRSGSGLFDASEAVSQDEWHRFFDAFGAQGRYKGVSIVGYAPVVAAKDRASFEQALKEAHGSSYTLQTTAKEKVSVPVLFARSYGETVDRPYGYDMYADPARRTAMDRARDTGQVTMTSAVQLVNAGEEGVLLYMPIYTQGAALDTVEERREALRGFVYASIRTSELFAGMQIKDRDSFGYSVSVPKDDDTTVIFRSSFVRDNPELQQIASSRIKQYGSEWNLRYYTNGNLVSPAESAQPTNVLIAGIVLALIVSAAVFFLIKYRTRMLAITEEQKLQKAKDELLSLASHQLRTPATGVKQYIGMVLDGFGGDLQHEQTKLLEQAYKSNERQLQIINEFLYVAKLGSGSLTTTKHQFDLAPLIRDIYEEMKAEIDEKNHTVTMKVPRSLPVWADQHSIRMVLENILSNAIKYTPAGGKIKISVQRGVREIRVVIQDTGVGIAKKDMGLLFKQFSRIPNELSSDVSGSGIGLYLAEQLAMRNGGRISVTSEPHKGSIFTLHLPLKKSKKNY